MGATLYKEVILGISVPDVRNGTDVWINKAVLLKKIYFTSYSILSI
jgi:hypothetical protein